jgi:hypothetical protein
MTNWDGVPGSDIVVESLPPKVSISPLVAARISTQATITNHARRAEN